MDAKSPSDVKPLRGHMYGLPVNSNVMYIGERNVGHHASVLILC